MSHTSTAHRLIAAPLARLVMVIAVLAWAAAGAAGQQEPQPAAKANAANTDLLSREARVRLIDALVEKWGAYVQVTHGQDVGVWRERLQNWAARIDANNLRTALTRDTYDSAMAALVGRDGRAAKALPDAADEGGVGSPQAIASRLGDVVNDLTYSPLIPCRIVDTRVLGGVIPAGGTRSFLAMTASNFASQGGSATDCGTSALAATAVALNVTAVAPAGAGYATVYPWNTGQPLAASVNYTAGAIVNNAIITRLPTVLGSFDFTLYSFAQSHYVIDIVGYFAPNEATPLDCQETAQNSLSLGPGAVLSSVAPSCPTGYFPVSTNCAGGTGAMFIVTSRNGVCLANNTGPTSGNLLASRTCCRVPGR